MKYLLASLLSFIFGWLMMRHGIQLYLDSSTLTIFIMLYIVAGGILLFYSGLLAGEVALDQKT